MNLELVQTYKNLDIGDGNVIDNTQIKDKLL